jgi:hypothetical protein
MPNNRLKQTGAAIQVFRGSTSLRRPRQLSLSVRRQEGFPVDIVWDGITRAETLHEPVVRRSNRSPLVDCPWMLQIAS